MSNLIINFREVGKTFMGPDGKLFQALVDVNLPIYAGELICVMGASGSGKTTLTNILGLLTRPTSGALEYFGQRAEKLTEDQMTEYRRHHIGFIFQDYLLLDHMNVYENVLLSQLLSSEPMPQLKQKVLKLIETVGLQDHIHKRPHQLSGGQKQRVAIARALNKSPRIIIADEPVAALDPKSRAEILELLSNLHQQGVTVIMITHNIEDTKYATRLLHVENARIVKDQILKPA